jgi:Ser-tRNA(Ala) deacylase AlaX
MNGTTIEGTTELEVINQIKTYQEQKQQLRLYISFLKDVKNINLLY